MPSTVAATGLLRSKAALSTVRSVLAALVLLGLLGSVAAVVSYRADVAEAHRRVDDRVKNKGRVYADSLALHFQVLDAELRLLAERGMPALRARGPEVVASVRDDRLLFADGVVLLDASGAAVWREPANLALPDLADQPWLQRLLRGERSAIDQLTHDDANRLALALPLKDGSETTGVLVGLIAATDQLLFGSASADLLLVGSADQVLVPRDPPSWTKLKGFSQHLAQLRQQPQPRLFDVEGGALLMAAYPVRNTALVAVALESEKDAIAPIRARLNVQLAFLLAVQLTALGAFVLFLRRTWRAFLDAEQRATEQEKMAALGSAASLIAHEVKNSLNGLNAATALLTPNGDAALASRTIRGQVERLSHLARSLLSFSRPAASQRVPFELDAVVRETVGALSALPEWPEVTVTLELEPDVRLASDPLLIGTVVDNLARNAIEASVAAKDLGRQPAPKVLVRVTRGDHAAVLRVEDNAGSAAVELERRLGEPFYTTKSKGIGLGLAMTKKAVDSVGATLHFERLAAGSAFTVVFPMTPRQEG